MSSPFRTRSPWTAPHIVNGKMVNRGSRPDPAASDGFNLVILMVSVSILNILLALALPAYSTQIQRQKEAELIFRGLQYAEAVRVFQLNHNRLPTQMRELIEVQPRSIRKLWKNPMDEEGRWCQVPVQNQSGGRNAQNPRNQQNPAGGSGQPDPSGPLGEPLDPGQPQCPPGAVLVTPPEPGELDFNPAPSLPFTGVSSPIGGEAFRSFMDSEEMGEWRFTMEMVSGKQSVANGALSVPLSSTSFWKPFPPGVTPPNPVQVQQPAANNGQNPAGRAGRNGGAGRPRPGSTRPASSGRNN